MGEPIASARVFDHMASTYDTCFSDTWLGETLRDAVQGVVEPWVVPGGAVADIGCGTGRDALWLAGRCGRVVAVDPSHEMVARTQERVRDEGVADVVEVRCARLEEFAADNRDHFDLILSNFGALNCVADLDAHLRELAARQSAGGMLAIVLMNRTCIWEQLWFLLHGRMRTAFRRYGNTQFEAGGEEMRVYYPTARSLINALSSMYELVDCRGIGVFLPPTWLDPLAARRPRLCRLLASLDRMLAHRRPFRHLGDHVLLAWRRRR